MVVSPPQSPVSPVSATNAHQRPAESPKAAPTPAPRPEDAFSPPPESSYALASDQEPAPQIEADAVDNSDTDSALGVPFRDSLTSLRSSIRHYQHENGQYFLPNDESEVDRLGRNSPHRIWLTVADCCTDLQHYVMTLTIGGNHCLCPKNMGAKRVLDLGTGTGIWSMEYGKMAPPRTARPLKGEIKNFCHWLTVWQVIGVDLSPVQPDLSIVYKAFDALEPGGYFEAQDMALPLGCDDGTLSVDSDLWKWVLLVMEGMAKFGRPVTAAEQWKQLMEEAGFEDVVETIYKWPTNRWPRDKHYKDLGMWSLENMDQALEPATLAPLTRALGWSYEEVIVLVSKARKVLRDTSVHAYWPM
ncbi:TAM domain methyltransferase [Colletotrichum chrysophilum]|uniref:TAM domain methyltransferase n=1 Tax=Colletotrichum chrysophilum TaxID=1836956 RepID=A0AAD9AN54_9PEZI|nr:TAM domain methyltransferase [Colletotrichum chrysophilum]